MAFIRDHDSSGKKYTFYTDTVISENKNIFTVLVGKNGSGKSRLLNSLVMRGIDEKKYVLAFSNSMYHKFPQLNNDKTFGYLCYANNKNLIKNYAYCNALHGLIDQELIHLAIEKLLFHEFPLMQFKEWNIQTLIPLLILKLKQDPNRAQLLEKILDFLGFEKNIHITFNKNKKLSEIFINAFNNQIFSFHDKTDNHEILKEIAINLCNNKLTDYYFPMAQNIKTFSAVGYGIALDLWKIKRINFIKKGEKISYRDLSSGETSFLTLGLFLLIFLENDTIICIDEPEINLHPEWQSQVINFLNSIFQNFNLCHFFIATHAPQIISGANGENIYIHDLEKNINQNINNFRNRSSDFQLSEVFNFPGNNNEYLIRKLIVILNKLNIEESYHLDSESQELLKNLEILIKNKKIHEDDKVFILFNLIASYRG
ncbi:AAA family ATPase [Acinetobacter chinensis]|uniref:AAA family ATPase n=1 Tax=Acinetobacter chinensis TaxID=2004650 RepID=A0ABU3WHZ6_9GAMM|nr:AAA family ATPase [Acinetobacter chinensis]MDV2470042.1 AAA family ATPase [Acinetobacter chinensis]